MIQKSQVVIQTAFIGDVFLSILFFNHLKKIYPDDNIVLVCKKGVADFFLQDNLVHQIIEIEKNNNSTYNEALKKINALSNVQNVFCLHKSFRSAFFTFRIKSQKSFGFKSFINSLFFSKSISYPKSWPDPIRQLSLLRLVDKELDELLKSKDWTALNQMNQSIPLAFQFKNKSQAFSKNKKYKVALFPGSVWTTKKWTEEGFSKVAKYLCDQNYEVFLMGGPDERDIADRINKIEPRTQIMAGQKKITESIEILKSCDFIVGNDSSSSHMAASVGTPVLAIFGPTTLNLGFRPWVNESAVVENNNLSCRPCGKHGHSQCPLGHHLCMKNISAETVISVIKNQFE